MKIKRILSSVLVVIMLFSAISVLIPVQAKAATYSDVNVNNTRLDTETVKGIVVVIAFDKAVSAEYREITDKDHK